MLIVGEHVVAVMVQFIMERTVWWHCNAPLALLPGLPSLQERKGNVAHAGSGCGFGAKKKTALRRLVILSAPIQASFYSLLAKYFATAMQHMWWNLLKLTNNVGFTLNSVSQCQKKSHIFTGNMS